MPERLLRLFGAGLLLASLVGCAGLGSQDGASPSGRVVAGQPPQQLIDLANEAQRKGRLSEALSHYQRVLTFDPEHARANVGAGEVLLEMHRSQEALEHFDRVLKSSPDMAVALEGRGYALLGTRRLREAESTLQKVVELNPARWRSWSALGVLADLRRDNRTAQSYYEKALLVLPGHPLLLNNRAFSMMLLGRYDEAGGLLRQALSHEPDNLRVRNNLAWCLAWQKQYDNALQVLAHGLPPAQAHNNVGYVAMLRQDYGVAIRYFNEAMALSPTYYERAANNLAEARRRMQQQVGR